MDNFDIRNIDIDKTIDVFFNLASDWADKLAGSRSSDVFKDNIAKFKSHIRSVQYSVQAMKNFRDAYNYINSGLYKYYSNDKNWYADKIDEEVMQLFNLILHDIAMHRWAKLADATDVRVRCERFLVNGIKEWQVKKEKCLLVGVIKSTFINKCIVLKQEKTI